MNDCLCLSVEDIGARSGWQPFLKSYLCELVFQINLLHGWFFIYRYLYFYLQFQIMVVKKIRNKKAEEWCVNILEYLDNFISDPSTVQLFQSASLILLQNFSFEPGFWRSASMISITLRMVATSKKLLPFLQKICILLYSIPIFLKLNSLSVLHQLSANQYHKTFVCHA